jgi:crotonobetainyl-CoA:carnitine CoA-transferase CaiB-like acyl-CoA transferase
MRYEAAIRLGVDYESLKTIKPDLIYCHSSGFDKSRAPLPGNDQTGACLAGVEWEDGGMDDGGKPIWSLTSFGDTGNAFLSANAMIQALYHRDRTGEGQFVATSILAACLVNTSYAWVHAASGEAVDRPKVDAMMFGTGPLHRLYKTADRWIVIAVQDDAQWAAMARTIDDVRVTVERFATAVGRDSHAAELIAVLTEVFRTRNAAGWVAALDAAGVPCEIEDDQFAIRLFDDPQFRDAGLVTTMQQAQVGRFDQFGHMWTFSETPTRIAGPPLIVGHDSVAIMSELGMDPTEIDALLAAGVVMQSELTQERAL